MRSWYQYIILAILYMTPYMAYSQPDCTTDPPLPPILQSLSVVTETGNIEFTWSLSPSSDIAAYILYEYDNGDGIPIDTIWDPGASTYFLSTTVTKYKSASFVVAAMRLPRCTSILSNVLSTIYVNASIDTCQKKIDLSWNSYIPYPKQVTGYSVLVAVDGGVFNEIAGTTSEVNSISVSDFTIDSEYCIVLKALLEDNSFSTSKKVCLDTKMQRPPEWINADQATVTDDGKIFVSFTVDPLSEITRYRIERKTTLTDSFSEIAVIDSYTGSVSYIDNDALSGNINYYRLSAINACNLPVVISNVASNIVLSINQSGDDINLSWNEPKYWKGMVSSYKLYIDTGKGFEILNEISPFDTVFTINYAEIMYQVTGEKACFLIEAGEKSNPHGIEGLSRSQSQCISPDELITVPNVFIPNSGNLNGYFRPILSFTPTDYLLVIQNRNGKVVFESRDFNASWDGSGNGINTSYDVCLWFLKVSTPGGKEISKTGTVTLLRKD